MIEITGNPLFLFLDELNIINQIILLKSTHVPKLFHSSACRTNMAVSCHYGN